MNFLHWESMRRVTLAFAVLFAAAAASAGEKVAASAWDCEAAIRYAGGGTRSIMEGGADRGAFRFDGAEYGLRRRVRSGRLDVVVGAQFERVSLRHEPGAPLPDQLQSAAGRVTVGWLFDRKSWLVVDLSPGFYGDDQLLAQDFNMPAAFTYHRLLRSDLRGVAGLSVNLTRDTPVFPFAGAVWQATSRWNLKLTVPNARAEYRVLWTPDATADVFAGLSFSGGQYRVSKDLGGRRGRPEIGGQILSFTTQQAVAGVRAAGKGLEAELFGGWAYARRLEFRRAAVRLDSDGAPILGASLIARF